MHFLVIFCYCLFAFACFLKFWCQWLFFPVITGGQLWWLFLSGSLPLSNLYMYLLCSDMVNKLLSLSLEERKKAVVNLQHGVGDFIQWSVSLRGWGFIRTQRSPWIRRWVSPTGNVMFVWIAIYRLQSKAATGYNLLTTDRQCGTVCQQYCERVASLHTFKRRLKTYLFAAW